MTRRLFLAAPVAVLPVVGGGEDTEFASRLVKHVQAVWSFALKYFGCPPDGDIPGSCQAHKAHTDYKLFDASRKTAQRLYNFPD